MGKLMMTDDHRFEPMSLITAAEREGLMFETSTYPYTLPNGELCTDHHFMYRELSDGTQVILNPNCAPQYGGELAYRLDFAYIENIFPGTCTGLRSWGHGRQVMATHDLGRGHTFGDGDRLKQYLIYKGGLDGMCSPTIATGLNRFFCENQLPSAEILFKGKRTVKHALRIVSRDDRMKQAAESFAQQVRDIERRKLHTLSDATVDSIFAKIVKMSADGGELKQQGRIDAQEAELRSLWNAESGAFGRNAEALYQAVHTLEHHRADEHGKMLQATERKGLPMSDRVLAMLGY